MTRRAVVHRWPAVPTAPKRMARFARLRSAEGVTMIPLFPPSSRIVRPKRSATTVPTRFPIRDEPVADTSGILGSFAINSPITEPGPIASEKTAGSTPNSRHTVSAIRMQAIAVRGTLSEGFHKVVSPHTAARALFHAQTAIGKLNAEMLSLIHISEPTRLL